MGSDPLGETVLRWMAQINVMSAAPTDKYLMSLVGILSVF